MDNNSRFNWQVRTAALSIFFLGFVAGALALNAYSTWFTGAQPTKQQQYQKVMEQLSLSDSQKTEIQQIVGDMRSEIQTVKKESEPKFQEIRDRCDARFQKTMTPEQWANFQRMRDEIRAKDENRDKDKSNK
jgi:exopolysaccharide biosynthesis protein